jgi:predicted alpha/beta-hydrolase family hydrolase
MHHPFLDTMAACLGAERIGTLRFQFPYMEAGRRRPDPPAVAVAAVQAAVGAAHARAGGAPVFAGGKSFGGRMTSTAAADGLLEGVAGLVFLGFPLHRRGRPSLERAQHLLGVTVPMLFVQGTRDPLAEPALVESVVRELGDRATLYVVEGGDHSFAVPKRMQRDPHEVVSEIARHVHDWMTEVR